MGIDLGRRVFGAAVFSLGLIALAWHDFDTWEQLHSLWNGPHGATLVYIVGTAEVAGGLALQWRRSARWGAIALGLVYLFFVLRWVPKIVATPRNYDPWGNIFEQLSLVSGSLIVFAWATPGLRAASRICQAGRYLFGVCVISFTLEQLVFLRATADFVPPWIPPGQMFWAITTTVAMGLGAIAILSGNLVIPASRLLTAMMVGFGLLVWLPRLWSDPHDHVNWGGNAQNLAITGASWIVADFFSRTRLAVSRAIDRSPAMPTG